jgi:uncharacterized protein YidB (DUF937 family)
MKALLGVLAVAGYQNRDKIGELLRGLQQPDNQQPDGQQTGDQQTGTGQHGGLDGLLGGLTGGGSGGLGGLGGLLGGAASGGSLAGGLSDLLKTFQQNGHGGKAESWVRPGANEDIDEHQLSQALGPEVLDDLSARLGLSPQDILSRLSRDLPRAVDDMTPDGQLPRGDAAEARQGGTYNV